LRASPADARTASCVAAGFPAQGATSDCCSLARLAALLQASCGGWTARKHLGTCIRSVDARRCCARAANADQVRRACTHVHAAAVHGVLRAGRTGAARPHNTS
jgi:hypothetical protein